MRVVTAEKLLKTLENGFECVDNSTYTGTVRIVEGGCDVFNKDGSSRDIPLPVPSTSAAISEGKWKPPKCAPGYCLGEIGSSSRFHGRIAGTGSFGSPAHYFRPV